MVVGVGHVQNGVGGVEAEVCVRGVQYAVGGGLFNCRRWDHEIWGGEEVMSLFVLRSWGMGWAGEGMSVGFEVVRNGMGGGGSCC